MYWHNKKVLVAGLGETGLSLLRFFIAEKVDVYAFDEYLSDEKKASLQTEFSDIPVLSGSLVSCLEQGFDILAVSPGIPTHIEAIAQFKANGGRVWGDVEIFAQVINQAKYSNSKVIAITGSNGKTTVTSLAGHLCQKMGLQTVVAGNIGLPVLTAYLQNKQNMPDVWVLELSSFQLDTTETLSANAATVLNISEDHLDRYDDLLDYAHSKDRVFHGSGTQVLNLDDVFCRAMARPNREVKWFSLQDKTDYWVDKSANSLKAGEENLLSPEQLLIHGWHNAANALVALALCEAIGLNRPDLLTHLQSFKGLPHRVEKVGEYQGITFIDDSKGTNVGATCAAIAGVVHPVVIILGGVGKGQDFSPLAPVLKEKGRAIVLIGKDASIIQSQLISADLPMVFAEDMNDAVNKSFEFAQSEDIVLLSPACASWDMFNGYEHRAQVFIKCVNQLSGNE